MADLFERVVEADEDADPRAITGLLHNRCTLCEAPLQSVQRFTSEDLEFFSPFVFEEDSNAAMWLGLCARCYEQPAVWPQSAIRMMWARRSQILN